MLPRLTLHAAARSLFPVAQRERHARRARTQHKKRRALESTKHAMYVNVRTVSDMFPPARAAAQCCLTFNSARPSTGIANCAFGGPPAQPP